MYNDAIGFKFIEYSPTLAHSKGKTLKGGKAVVCTVLKIVGILRWEIFSMETSKCHEGAVMRIGAATVSMIEQLLPAESTIFAELKKSCEYFMNTKIHR